MDTGRFLIIAGTVIIVVGFIFLMADKIPLGRLPGDLKFGSEKFRVYIPIATCVLLRSSSHSSSTSFRESNSRIYGYCSKGN